MVLYWELVAIRYALNVFVEGYNALVLLHQFHSWMISPLAY